MQRQLARKPTLQVPRACILPDFASSNVTGTLFSVSVGRSCSALVLSVCSGKGWISRKGRRGIIRKEADAGRCSLLPFCLYSGTLSSWLKREVASGGDGTSHQQEKKAEIRSKRPPTTWPDLESTEHETQAPQGLAKSDGARKLHTSNTGTQHQQNRYIYWQRPWWPCWHKQSAILRLLSDSLLRLRVQQRERETG